MDLKRPNPIRCDLDDLVGQKVAATSEVNDRFDDRILYGVLLEDGRVWTSSMSDDDQEDRCFVELGLWTAEEAKQYRQALKEKTDQQIQQRQLGYRRDTYLKLKQEFEPDGEPKA